MSARRLLAVLAVLLTLAGAASPAAASRGGLARATGVTAVAAEVTVDVTTSGVIGSLGPVVDRLTAGPVIRGRQLTAVRADSPPEPEGAVRDSRGPVELGSMLVVEAVTARTQRVEDGALSATADVGGGRIDLLGLSVLDVGAVSSRVTTHPDQPPTASTSVRELEVFGSPVTLPAAGEIDVSHTLSTDQVLVLLEELAPEVSPVTGLLTRVGSAAGSVDVTMGRVSATDPVAGAAHATGFAADVALGLVVALCIPELRGTGCVGEVGITVDAQVLDLSLAEVAAERPTAVGPRDVTPWTAVPLLALATAVLLAVGIRTTRRRRAPS